MAQHIDRNDLHVSEFMPAYVAASIVPYVIGSGMKFEEYPGVDWMDYVSEPAFFEAGPAKIDACMLIEIESQLLLAVRATQFPEPGERASAIVDWLNDLRAEPIDSVQTGLPGSVHKGFWKSWTRLLDAGAGKAVVETVAKTGKPLVICGYSKGGGVAPMAAMSLLRLGLRPTQIDGVVLFEAPRAGDASFAQAYMDVLGEKTVRYAYRNDIIPHLPPSAGVLNVVEKLPVLGKLLSDLYGDLSIWSPTHVGKLQFIDWDGNIQTDSPALEVQRTSHLIQMIGHLRIKDVLNDHLPNTGFVVTLVPDRECPWHFRLL